MFAHTTYLKKIEIKAKGQEYYKIILQMYIKSTQR